LSELGDRLRDLRRRAGLTGDQVAARTGLSQSKISRIETGATTPSLDDVAVLTRATGATEAELREIAGLVEHLATTATSWRILHQLGLTGKQRAVAELEARADVIRIFQPVMVPGLLQIVEYTRQLMLMGNPSGQADIAGAVAARMDRQMILYDQAKQFDFVVTEGALRFQVGSSDVMRAQLDRIQSLASLPNLTLSLIPAHAQAFPHLHPFVIFESAETLVTIETYTAELQVHEPRDVERYHQVLDRLKGSALTGQDALVLLRSIMPDLTEGA